MNCKTSLPLIHFGVRRALASAALFAALLMPMSALALPGGQSDDHALHLQMRDGGLIQVTAADEEIKWKSVAIDGQISESTIRLSQIKSLSLAGTPASVQVAEIRRLVHELADDDYHKRHVAEQRLGVEGLPFITIIEQFRDHAEPEARYRVARILDRLKNNRDDSRAPVAVEFDVLETVDGRTLEGDIGDWTLSGSWRDQPVRANRDNCSGMSVETTVNLLAPRENADEPIRVDHVVSIDHFTSGNQPRAGIQMATFETANNDISLDQGMKDPVETMFSFLGCLLRCQTEDGNVIISGYKFKKGLSRKNSVSNLYRDAETGKMTRYSGVMQIGFCLPGQPKLGGSVNSAGLGTEIVVPEHTLVQAWNSAGHLVGVTWSTADRNSFIGFDSNTDIAWLTVSANEHLKVDKLNRDFAVDDLLFSRPSVSPQLIPGDPDDPLLVIVTSDGNRVFARSLSFSNADSAVLADVSTGDAGQVSIPLGDVRWIVGGQPGKPASEPFAGMSVMTRDGSVVHVDPQLNSLLNSDLQVPTDQIIGFWKPADTVRYPHPDDFEHGSVVAVEPLHRIAFAGSVDWSQGTLGFDLADGKTIRQPESAGAGLSIKDAELSDLNLEMAEDGAAPLSDCSNIWLSAPVNRTLGTGLLRMTDGQQFVLGGTSGFALEQADGDQVTIGRDDQSLSIPVTKIISLEFPNP